MLFNVETNSRPTGPVPLPQARRLLQTRLSRSAIQRFTCSTSQVEPCLLLPPLIAATLRNASHTADRARSDSWRRESDDSRLHAQPDDRIAPTKRATVGFGLRWNVSDRDTYREHAASCLPSELLCSGASETLSLAHPICRLASPHAHRLFPASAD